MQVCLYIYIYVYTHTWCRIPRNIHHGMVSDPAQHSSRCEQSQGWGVQVAILITLLVVESSKDL